MRKMPSIRHPIRTGAFFRRLIWRPLLPVLAVASIVTAADAQKYRTDPVDPQAKRHSGVMLSVIRNPGRYAADKDKFREYFAGYYFPEMTQDSPGALGSLGDRRYDLFRRYLWATNNAQIQQDLTELAFDAARRIVAASNPPYHPSVRYNAVLILGQLDKQYAADGRPPVPLPESTVLLTKIVAAAEDRRISPAMTLGALIGLERHAKYSDALPAETLEPLTAALLKLIGHEKPIQEMDRETFDWLRLRAAGILAQLGNVGPNNVVHDALLKLIADFRTLDNRLATAALLGKLKFEGAKVDGAATAKTVFELARDLGSAEAKRAEEFQNARIGGGSVGPARGEMFMAVGGSGQQETFPRRHVLARLTDLRTALRAIKPLVPEDTQAKVDALLQVIQPVIAAAENKDTVELKLAASIHTLAAAIDREAAAAVEPAAEEEKAAF